PALAIEGLEVKHLSTGWVGLAAEPPREGDRLPVADGVTTRLYRRGGGHPKRHLLVRLPVVVVAAELEVERSRRPGRHLVGEAAVRGGLDHSRRSVDATRHRRPREYRDLRASDPSAIRAGQSSADDAFRAEPEPQVMNQHLAHGRLRAALLPLAAHALAP